MSFLRSSRGLLTAIMVLALAIRLPAIGYGLPYHLFGDEETNVYGALKMLELKTLLPVLHPHDFTILYEPPVLAYAYAALFIPTIGVFWACSGFPSFETLQHMLVLDPSILWYVARGTMVLISLGSIYLVYRIGRSFFRSERISLYAALFMALSFFETTLASTARHWEAGTFFGLLAFFFACRAFDAPERRARALMAAGAALGFAFGVSYLVLYAPFIAVFIAYEEYRRRGALDASCLRRIAADGLLVGVPFLLLSGLFILVHPYPLSVQVLTHVDLPEREPLGAFLAYFARVLWNFETPLALFGIAGIIALAWRKHASLILFVLFFATVGALAYVFLSTIERYAMPLMPMLALLAGYGLDALGGRLRASWARAALVGLVLFYGAALFARYEALIARNDTRVAAMQWLESSVPAQSSVIINSDRIRLFGTKTSLAVQDALASSSLRAPDRLLLGGAVPAKHQMNVYALYALPADTQKALIAAALARDPHAYIVVDAWAPPAALPSNMTLVKRWQGSAALPGVDALFIGGEDHHAPEHVLELVWGLPQLGPEISVYRAR